ncbi:MAG: autotransporter outer membrane beta-barrel domain-containing protein [Burkholderiaceae bacterium]
MPTRLQSRLAFSALGIGVVALWGTEVHAQTRNLPVVPGLTEIQKPVAAAIDAACVGLTGKGAAARMPEEEKLFVSCRKMVQTANVLAGGSPTTNANSLGLNNAQLRDAVQAVGHEEVAINGRSAVEAAGGSAIGIRLFALRNGARGFGVADAGTASGSQRSTASLPESGGGAADEPGGRLGGFINISYNKGDKATTAREDGFDFANTGVTAGMDYRFNDNFVGGAALTYGKTDATIASALGSADSKSGAISLYASWYQRQWYVDGHLSYSRNRYDTTRRIVVASQSPTVAGFDTSAAGRTHGNQMTAVIGTGYDIERGSLLITPYGRLGVLKLKIDAYTETEPNHGLALDVGSQSLKSVQSALGLKIALTSSTAMGVVVPFASIEWNHEFDNDTRSLTAKYTNDPFNNFFAIPTDTPDRNYATLSVGISSQFRNGLSAFATLSTVEGLKDVKNRGFVVGLRKEF